MDTWTAFLRCHELHYEELGSVQVLLEVMREYQCLALKKLSNANLKFILWNWVLVVLQKEVERLVTSRTISEIIKGRGTSTRERATATVCK